MAIPDRRKFFGLESSEGDDRKLDLASRMERCLRPEFEHRFGLPPEALAVAVEREITRSFAANAFEDLATVGVDVAGKRLLDLGSGMGSVSVEAALRGAHPIAIEPGRGLREVACDRLREVGQGLVMAADAESLPLRDASIDVAVSLQVLEHVANPRAMLQEVFRVLRPGGVFLLTCENYLSFREGHYRVAWLPLLPKPIGAAYLRLRGRSPEFLYNSVTYVTRPGVMRMLRECGFRQTRKEQLDALAKDPSRIPTAWKRWLLTRLRRVVSPEAISSFALTLHETRRLCSGVICEMLRKPA